jgi:ABC-2 type transport system permease protein
VSALRSYRLLVVWQLRRARLFLPIAVVVQALLAVGIVLGYPLLFPQLDPLTTLFLATGAPTIALISMGLVLVPQIVAQAKTEGSLDYMRSLPVPRVVYLLADLTVWLAVVLPGVVFAIVVAALRFGLDLHVSPLVVPALLLVAFTSASIGYAIASLLPPMLANLTTQVLVVFVLMFSPLTFPAERLPDWLAAVHRALPIQAMGEVVRGT